MFGFTQHAIFVLFAWQGTWCETTIFCQDGATVPLASFIDVGPVEKQPGTRLEKKESPHEEQNDPENGLTYPMKHSPTLQQTSPLSNKNNDPTIKWPTPRRTGRSYEEIEKPPRPRVTHPTRNHTTLPRIVQTTQRKRLPTLRRTTVDYVPNVVLKILKTLTPLHPN